MYVTSTMMPIKSSTPAESANSVSSNTKTKPQNSFSDLLSNAVSQSDTTALQDKNQTTEQAVNSVDTKNANTLVVPAPAINLVQQDGQASAETKDMPSGETVKSDDNAIQTSQDLASMVNNAMLTAQMLFVIPTTSSQATPPPIESIGSIESSVATSTAVTLGTQSQTMASLPELSPFPQPTATLTTLPANNATTSSQFSQNQELLLNPVQTNQANTAAALPNEMIPSVTDQDKTQQLPISATIIESSVPGPVVVNQATGKFAATKESLNETTGEPSQQVVDSVLFPVAKPQEENATMSFTGNGQEETPADLSLYKQSKVIAELDTDTAKPLTSDRFAQALESVLMPKSDITVAAITETQPQTKPSTDVYQVVDQIIEQTRLITKPQNTEMIIKLKPEHLGELTLKVVVENGAVNASFHSASAEVRNLIEASLPQLKQDLANNGLKVDNVSVYAGLSQFLPNHDHDRSSRQQLMKLTNKKASGDFVEAIEGQSELGQVSRVGNDSGVDYRI